MLRRSQGERSEASRAAIVREARRLFETRGYSDVSLEDVGAAAGLTKGAVYHHFGGKKGLFGAVLEEVEADVVAAVTARAGSSADLAAALREGLAAFLDVCERPGFIRVALTDAPAVIGWQAWREIESRHGLGLITAALAGLSDRGVGLPAPVPVLAQLLLSALIEAALMVAAAPDPVISRSEVERGLGALLSAVLGQVSGREAEASPRVIASFPDVASSD